MRTLCYRCRDSYELAGYRCKWTGNKQKSACDLCGRPGVDYNILKKGAAQHGKQNHKAKRPGTSENVSK
nr:MAG TPA: Putative trypsin inhibitor ATTI-2, trypsin inhibitor, chymotrypsin inhibitor [Caudoviricetes sp.]